jgi:hypothetical protein
MKTLKTLAVACGLAIAVFAVSSPDSASAGGCYGGGFYGGYLPTYTTYRAYTPVYTPIITPSYGYDYGCFGHDCYGVRRVVVQPSLYLDSYYGY